MLEEALVSLDRSRGKLRTYMARGAVSAARTMISLTPRLRVLVASLAPFLSCLSIEELALSPWGERAGLDLQWLDCCTRSSISCASPVSATYSRGGVSMEDTSYAARAQTKSQRSECSVADTRRDTGEDQLTGQAADCSFAMLDKGFTAAARPLKKSKLRSVSTRDGNNCTV